MFKEDRRWGRSAGGGCSHRLAVRAGRGGVPAITALVGLVGALHGHRRGYRRCSALPDDCFQPSLGQRYCRAPVTTTQIRRAAHALPPISEPGDAPLCNAWHPARLRQVAHASVARCGGVAVDEHVVHVMLGHPRVPVSRRNGGAGHQLGRQCLRISFLSRTGMRCPSDPGAGRHDPLASGVGCCPGSIHRNGATADGWLEMACTTSPVGYPRERNPWKLQSLLSPDWSSRCS